MRSPSLAVRAAPRRTRVRHIRRPPAILAALGAAALAAFGVSTGAGCRRESRAVFAGAPVFLVSIDTLRADHLAICGGRGAWTPAIDALARDGVVFETAISHVPLTLPSHAALFTGLLPFQNGVRDNLGYRLDSARPTIASLLRARGYETGGAVSAVVLDHGTGISSGFDFWDDAIEAVSPGEPLAEVRRAGAESERRMEEWIDRSGNGKANANAKAKAAPLFGFLHLYEPHAPYVPPEPFRSRYAAAPYDGTIAAADAVVGDFVAFLKSRGLYDRSVVVLLSDHGEGLGDHGEAEHGVFLYREAIRVPLVLKLPGNRDAGRRVRTAVGLTDVMPTVLGLVGIAAPAGTAGTTVWPSPPPEGSRRLYSETMFPRFHFGWSDLASLTDEKAHYIHAPRAELYEWESDPGEKRDLSAALSPAFRSMRAALEAMARPLEPPGASDPETVRKLASLGYVGASSGAAKGALPDPKDRIALVARLAEAGRRQSAGQVAEAVAILEAVVRENPDMAEARQSLARALVESGRLDEAWRQLLEVDRAHPGIPPVMLALADLALARGDASEARRYALAAESAGSEDAGPVLASIAIATGNLGEARARTLAAVRARPASRPAWLLLAQIEEASGNPPAALEALARLDAVSPRAAPLRDASFLRGDVLAKLGRTEEARAAFTAEIRGFPDNPRGHTGLALLDASAGRRAEAEADLAALLSHARTADSYFLAARIYELLGDRTSASRTRADAARRFPGARDRPGASDPLKR